MASVGLSNEQWLILRDMVNNHKTGTDERMTGLPDGQHTIATKEGSVKLSKNLKLGNVLFVPRPHFEDVDWCQ
ncbi:hypothetical protein KY284_036005 [Solanum tuberosum]|nr:hypothetical protein KY284_036005 [Solanum tuberosum]